MDKPIDTNSYEWLLECKRRHLARIAELKAAKTRTERVDIFRRIEAEVNINEARSCWTAAFPKK